VFSFPFRTRLPERVPPICPFPSLSLMYFLFDPPLILEPFYQCLLEGRISCSLPSLHFFPPINAFFLHNRNLPHRPRWLDNLPFTHFFPLASFLVAQQTFLFFIAFYSNMPYSGSPPFLSLLSPPLPLFLFFFQILFPIADHPVRHGTSPVTFETFSFPSHMEDPLCFSPFSPLSMARSNLAFSSFPPALSEVPTPPFCSLRNCFFFPTPPLVLSSLTV